MAGNPLALQAPTSWHHQGMYMGMHWGWWLFWLAALAILLWAFWRLLAERSDTHREAEEMLQAEEILRRRFARGELDEEEFARRLAALQASARPLSEVP